MDKRKFIELSRKDKIEYLLKHSNQDVSNDPMLIEKESFPLTDLQTSFLSTRFLSKQDAKIGCQVYLEFEVMNLNRKKLQNAWNKLINRHEMLRAQFIDSNVQKIDVKREYTIFFNDCTAYSEEEKEKIKQKERKRLSHKYYGILEKTFYEIGVTYDFQGVSTVHFSIDELIVDAFSINLLLEEWLFYYQNEEELPVLNYSFKEFVLEQNSSLNKQKSLDYWMEKYEKWHIPSHDKLLRENIKDNRRSRHQYRLSAKNVNQIKDTARKSHVTVASLLLTLYEEVLQLYSGVEKLPIIITHLNRNSAKSDTLKTVGPFVTTSLLQSSWSDNDSFADNLNRSKEKLFSAVDYSDVSGIKVLLDMKRKGLIESDYSVPFVFTCMQSNEETLPATFLDSMTFNITQTPEVLIDCQIFERGDELDIQWDSTDGCLRNGLAKEMFGTFISRILTVIFEKETLQLPIFDASKKYDLTPLQEGYVIQNEMTDIVKKERLIYQEYLVNDVDEAILKMKYERVFYNHPVLSAVLTDELKWQPRKLDFIEPDLIDLTHLSTDKKEEKVESIRNERKNDIFTIYSETRLRCLILKLSHNSFLICMSADPFLIEGQSLSVFMKDFLGTGESKKDENHFFQFIQARKKFEAGDQSHSEKEYWFWKINQLSESPFSTGKLKCSTNQVIRLSAEILNYSVLAEQSNQNGFNIDDLLLAAYAKILRKYSEKNSFSLVNVSGLTAETEPSIHNSIGEFTSIGWIDIPNVNLDLWELARIVRTQRIGNIKAGNYDPLVLRRQRRDFPELAVVYTDLMPELKSIPNVRLVEGISHTPEVILDNISMINEEALQINWDVDLNHFPNIDVRKMFSEYKHEILKAFGSERSIYSEFEKISSLYKNCTAVQLGETKLTYGELADSADLFCRAILMMPDDSRPNIGICVDRKPEMISAVLGILKAGKTYVPIDPSTPYERIHHIVEDSEVAMIITDNTTETLFHENFPAIKCLSVDEIQKSDVDMPPLSSSRKRSEHPAYIIYTSGSTGKPKGVAVSHENVINLINNTDTIFDMSSTDIWSMSHSFAFDFSVWEIFGALLHGARLLIIPRAIVQSFSSFYRLISEEKVTVMSQTPTAFKQFITADKCEKNLLSLRYIIFGGEKLDFEMLKDWFTRHEDSSPKLINMYGITETTVHSSYYQIHHSDVSLSESVIGSPIPGVDLFICNKEGELMAENEIGEICVGGQGVALGYFNNPDLTNEKFRMTSFSNKERVYFSGDLGKFDKQGRLIYQGRADNQVKVRGYRIELDEVLIAIKKVEGVMDAHVCITEDAMQKHITAFIVSETDVPLSLKNIRQQLKNRVPDYMLPTKMELVRAFPLTLNGKLDEKKLLDSLNINTVKEVEIQEKQPCIDQSNLERIVKNKLQLVLPMGNVVQTIEMRDDIFDLGATSLTLVKLSNSLKESIGVEIPVEELLKKSTIKEIVAYIKNKLSEKEQAVDFAEPNSYTKEQFSLTSELGAEKENLEIRSSKSPNLIELENRVKKLLMSINLEKFDDLETDIFDIGATSLSLVQINRQVLLEFNVNISVDYLLKNSRVADIVYYLAHDEKTEAMTEKRKSIREKDGVEKLLVTEQLPELLTVFQQKIFSGKRKFMFPSAGGKYAVQVYLIVPELKATAQLPAGSYYYHPEENRLYQIRSYLNTAQKGFEKCTIFFVAEMTAIEPIYMDLSEFLVLLDVGYMKELFLAGAKAASIKVRESVIAEHEVIQEMLKLGESHTIMTSFTLTSLISDNEMTDCLNEDILDYQFQKNIFQNIEYKQLSRKEVINTAREKRHLRKDLDSTHFIDLKDNSFTETNYIRRSSKRMFDQTPVVLITFLNWLEKAFGTIADNLIEKELKVLILIKKDFLVGLNEGLYSYDKMNHRLLFESKVNYQELVKFQTPFNRPHFKSSQFCLFLMKIQQHENDLTGVAACAETCGQIGQRLMLTQSDYGIGTVPIGGMLFSGLNDFLGIENQLQLIHSFFGGAYAYENSAEEKSESVGKTEPLIQTKETNISEEIGILGMSNNYPGANTLKEFHQVLLNAQTQITSPSNQRIEFWGTRPLDLEDYSAGYLKNIDKFDSERFQITPKESENMDPQEKIMLKLVKEAMDQAGFSSEFLEKSKLKVGVFIGTMWGDFSNYGYQQWLDKQRITKLSLSSSIASKISYHFDYSGPSLSVQTACTSGITAMSLAKRSIEAGECDIAIVGGINLVGHPSHIDALKSQEIYSKSNKVALYDDKNSGLIIGEGAAIFVLSKVSAEKESNALAIIADIESGHNGHTKRYGMVDKKSQENLISKMLKKKNLIVDDIDYVETAATGLVAADLVEVAALENVFADRKTPIEIGSVKANFGHLEAASFMVQLTKVILMMQQGIVYPTVCETDAPLISDKKNVKLARVPTNKEINNVLISTFGASGTNGVALIRKPDRKLPDSKNDYCYEKLISIEESIKLSKEKEKANGTVLADKKNEIEEEYAKIKTNREKLIEYLKQIYSSVTGYPTEKILPTNNLYDYGFSSEIIMRMNEFLENDFGIRDKTVLFQVSSLTELADLLVESFGGETAYIEKCNSEPNEPIKIATENPKLLELDVVALKPTIDLSSSSEKEEYAIVGMSGEFPKAANLQEFWENLENGVDCITEIPEKRWDHSAYYDPNKVGKAHSKWGGFIDSALEFDSLFFNISPNEAKLIDPQERKFLEVAYKTFENGGYSREKIHEILGGEVGVFVGAMFNDYQLYSGPSEDNQGEYLSTGAVTASISNRVSYYFNLSGPSITVNTMCSSSISALKMAVDCLKNNEIKMALVGGVNLITHQNKYILHSQNKMLSTDGRCKAFGADADGFVPSETVGGILVKKLVDAKKDHDHIYGVIKGIGINHDGHNQGYMVPNPVAQKKLITNVIKRSGLTPSEITYVEAHGTGTSLGDPIEITALEQAYRDCSDKEEKQISYIGSVKSNIGHAESAAGIASIIKVLLQFENKKIVRTLHCDKVNPNLDFSNSPFILPLSTTEWQSSGKRAASVSSFGAGGVNGYLILEEYTEPRGYLNLAEYYIPISGDTSHSLRENANEMNVLLKKKVTLEEPVSKRLERLISEKRSLLPNCIDEDLSLYELGFDYESIQDLLGVISKEFGVQLDTFEKYMVSELSLKVLERHIAEINQSDKKLTNLSLGSIAKALSSGREHGKSRLIVIVKSIAELTKALDLIGEGLTFNNIITADQIQNFELPIEVRDWLLNKKNQFYLYENFESTALLEHRFLTRKFKLPKVTKGEAVKHSDDEKTVSNKSVNREDEAVKIISDITGLKTDEISFEDSLARLGFDSIMLTTLKSKMEDLYNTEIPMAKLGYEQSIKMILSELDRDVKRPQEEESFQTLNAKQEKELFDRLS
jgi:amino acid adenylation domain-containing protein